MTFSVKPCFVYSNGMVVNSQHFYLWNRFVYFPKSWRSAYFFNDMRKFFSIYFTFAKHVTSLGFIFMCHKFLFMHFLCKFNIIYTILIVFLDIDQNKWKVMELNNRVFRKYFVKMFLFNSIYVVWYHILSNGAHVIYHQDVRYNFMIVIVLKLQSFTAYIYNLSYIFIVKIYA